ncbi:MAG TPA: hypothetical protein VJT82_08925 [Pyrinomonadaceae bacterium]|nr:hypothetical protein [Pyrinomonadaceae bacterium]
MKRFNLAIFAAALVLMSMANVALAASDTDGDGDRRLVNVRVIEVNDEHISVVTRDGVEHVVAVCQVNTKVQRGKEYVHCKDLRVDDVVTIELDEAKPVKFAKSIVIREMVADNQP